MPVRVVCGRRGDPLPKQGRGAVNDKALCAAMKSIVAHLQTTIYDTRRLKLIEIALVRPKHWSENGWSKIKIAHRSAKAKTGRKQKRFHRGGCQQKTAPPGEGRRCVENSK